MTTLEVTYLPHQPAVFDCPARNVVYVKGRRAGGTMGAVNRLVELAHSRPGSRHLWVDTVQRNIDRYVRRYFLPLLRGTACRWRGESYLLEFEGGAHCDFASAERPELMEGFAYDYIWVNEAGLVLRNEALYYSTLLPMVLESPKAQLFFIGAPKGPGLFERMFRWGSSGDDAEWASFRHPSHVNPKVNARELERLREHMPEAVYRQEILAEFISGEGAVFRGVERIAQAVPQQAPTAGNRYVMGVDLARYGDYTVAWVGCCDTGEAVHCDRFRRLPWNAQVNRLAALARRFGASPVYVDATGVGDPVCEELSRAGVPVERVVLTADRKQNLIDQLAVTIEQERLRIAPHADTVAELNAYTYSAAPSGRPRFSAPTGGHDDCVIALALCLQGMVQGAGEFILGSRMVSSEPTW